MNISEMISQLEALKEKHGDLKVMIQADDDYHGTQYWEVETVDAKINEFVSDDEDENSEDEYLNFIALDYM